MFAFRKSVQGALHMKQEGGPWKGREKECRASGARKYQSFSQLLGKGGKSEGAKHSERRNRGGGS